MECRAFIYNLLGGLHLTERPHQCGATFVSKLSYSANSHNNVSCYKGLHDIQQDALKCRRGFLDFSGWLELCMSKPNPIYAVMWAAQTPDVRYDNAYQKTMGPPETLHFSERLEPEKMVTE